MAQTRTGMHFWNQLTNPTYSGRSFRRDSEAQPAAGLERRIVPCNVCFLYPTNPELVNTVHGANYGMTFCWPCAGRRLNTIVPGGSPQEHEEILLQVNFIRSRSEAWRLEVDSTVEGAALRVATFYAGLEHAHDASGRTAYVSENIREFLVLLGQKTRMNMRVYTVLDVPIQRLDDMALVGLTGCLQDSREAIFQNAAEFAEGVVFTPPESCATLRDGWRSSANLG